MAQCEVCNNGNTWSPAKLYWVCPGCVRTFNTNMKIYYDTQLALQANRREYRGAMLRRLIPILGILAGIAFVSEVLYYFH